MIAEFSIHPLDATCFSTDVQRIANILKSSRLPYRAGPIGTCVEGEWDEVMSLVRKCCEAMSAEHERVIATITLDMAKSAPPRLKKMVEEIDIVHSRLPHGDMEVEC